ncbi:MAG: hypothetical protein M1814_000800 [Vezdaea aestivalis]|nr:MAG: hypothetical protein M1814_000800 [Vezdaea aestivalis]
MAVETNPLALSPDMAIISHSTLPTKPAPVFDPTVYSHHLSHSTSHFSSPEAPDTPSGSSTASFSQPVSPAHSLRAGASSRPYGYPESTASARSGLSEKDRWGSVDSTSAPWTGTTVAAGGAGPAPAPVSQSRTEYVTRIYDDDDLVETISPRLAEKAFPILVYLSFLVPLTATLTTLYTLALLLFTILASPLRLFITLTPFSQSLLSALSPLHRFHTTKIYAPPFPDASLIPARLIIALLLAPLPAFVIMVASWVAASFWMYAAILGDPDGSGKGNDGARTALIVRGWWAGWWARAVRAD